MMADRHTLMPYLGVPMQSGCDKILKLMTNTAGEMQEFFLSVVENVWEFVLEQIYWLDSQKS